MRNSVSFLVAVVVHLGRAGRIGEVTASRPVDLELKRPCPLAEDILPCVCSFDEDDYELDLDCSAVVDENELGRVFEATFPFTLLRRLTIEDNQDLEVLPSGVFGEVQFKEIYVTHGALQTVDDGAFWSSSSTAVTLDLKGNNIDFFPFDDLGNFTVLESFDVSSNNLTDVTPLSCGSLRKLVLNHNELRYLRADVFADLPSLQEVRLADIQLLRLWPGTFSGLEDLRTVALESNLLASLPEEAFHLSTDVRADLDLTDNLISDVSVGAFRGLANGSVISLYYNDLQYLEEEVWRPVLEAGVILELGGNPLTCGCEVAWVIFNKTAWLPHLWDTTCYDGVPMADLDPLDYLHFC